MYNYMTSQTPPKTFDLHLLYFLSHSLSYTNVYSWTFIETRTHKPYMKNWRVASHGVDINLINMMMKWTWNKSFAVFKHNMNEKREEREQWSIFHVCSQWYQSQLNASENMSAWEEMTRNLTSIKSEE